MAAQFITPHRSRIDRNVLSNGSDGPPTLPAPTYGNHETRDDAVYAGVTKPEGNRRRARSVEI